MPFEPDAIYTLPDLRPPPLPFLLPDLPPPPRSQQFTAGGFVRTAPSLKESTDD
jgi:hypothetical protein